MTTGRPCSQSQRCQLIFPGYRGWATVPSAVASPQPTLGCTAGYDDRRTLASQPSRHQQLPSGPATCHVCARPGPDGSHSPNPPPIPFPKHLVAEPSRVNAPVQQQKEVLCSPARGSGVGARHADPGRQWSPVLTAGTIPALEKWPVPTSPLCLPLVQKL